MVRGRARALAVGAGLIAVLIVVGGFLTGRPGGTAFEPRGTALRVPGVPEADGSAVTLDARLYLPQRTPAPAVLLGHGYGGSQESVAGQARELARDGYVVLAWSARGFGDSGGLVHLNSPDYEVKDAQRLLDLLAGRPEVRRDGAGDPRVGVAGASYGGALALLLAGTDPRVDAIVPSVTWNDLRQALFPQFATETARTTPAQVTPSGGAGVFKRQWAALLFQLSAFGEGQGPDLPGLLAGVADANVTDGEDAGTAAGTAAALAAACGRLARDLCLGYAQAATTGRPTDALLDLLAASSPARVAERITAPTLLVQGQTDSLFPLSEADANARAIASAGTPVRVVWGAGGHDASGLGTARGNSGAQEAEQLREQTTRFLDGVLRGNGETDLPGLRVTVPDAVVSLTDANPAPQSRSARELPGLPHAKALTVERIPLTAGSLTAVSPPGATPAAITSLPGIGGLLGRLDPAAGAGLSPDGGTGEGSGLRLGLLPGQFASFETAPLPTAVTIAGSPRVTVRITSSAADATLFASLLDVAPDGATTQPRGLVSPVRLRTRPGEPVEVTLALPAIVRDVPAGHRLRVVLASTDQGYALPADARVYLVGAAADRALKLPVVPMAVDGDGPGRARWPAAGLLALATLLVVAGSVLRGRFVRRRSARVEESLRDVPLQLLGLAKEYGDGFRAVDDVSFRVETGQVMGLLGPNGAGKTTVLRMLTGLILPSNGEIRLFGHQVTPGAAVLSRLGAFIEGPGFLPHLSGSDNLELFWRATGRREDPHLDVVLAIAGLGDDVHRRVRTYSQGMRQRLAIAQAMLGLPDLLVLDEPANGLDPPQIRQMREVLRRYAATGRTVLVSSHLLAEVEQTCSHVVVMAAGRVVAAGEVAELIGGTASAPCEIDVDDPVRAAALAGEVEGVEVLSRTDGGLLVRADRPARSRLVAALAHGGVDVDRVAPRRGLEDAFIALVGEGGE